MKAEKPFEGYTVYKRLFKDLGRYMAMLYHPETKHRTTISWARYLMSVHLGRKLDPDLETVDHVNENKLDDRLDNFELKTRAENTRKSAKKPNMVTLVCPVCSKEFTRRREQTHLVKGGDSTTCSRRCGGIKSHW